jgi:uncharacterized protein (DUF2461 family)
METSTDARHESLCVGGWDPAKELQMAIEKATRPSEIREAAQPHALAEMLMCGPLEADLPEEVSRIVRGFDVVATLKSSIVGVRLGAVMAVLSGPRAELVRFHQSISGVRISGLTVRVRLFDEQAKFL